MIRVEIPYQPFEALKPFLELSGTDTGDDALLWQFALTASRMLDGATARRFYPVIETRHYEHPDDVSRLLLDEDLLEVATFTTNNANVTLAETDYYLMCGHSYNHQPYDRIVMNSDGSYPNLLYSGTPQKANAVTGAWGYHEDWGNAWQDSGDTVQDGGGISASITTVTVSNVDGADIYGQGQRFYKQHLLKIGEEYLYVTGYDISANTLTVIRGVNGSTAAAHDNAAPIYVYRPMREIEHAAQRLASYLYAQKDTPYMEKILSAQAGIITVPDGAPLDVKATVARFKRWYER